MSNTITRNDNGHYAISGGRYDEEPSFATLEDSLEQEQRDQFQAMFYTIECKQCGYEIIAVLTSDDLGGSEVLRETQEAMNDHNLTHWVQPEIQNFNSHRL